MNISFAPKVDHLASFPSDSISIDLTGKIIRLFNDDCFARFTDLKNLELSSCKLLSLPISLFKINTLEYLDLSNNELTQIPLELGSMPNLKRLITDGNRLNESQKIKITSNDESFLKSLQIANIEPEIITRRFVPEDPSPSSLMVLSYNILSPSFATPKIYPFSLPKYLSTEIRLCQIKRQLIEHPYSIICLQEVQYEVYNNALHPFMEEQGYRCEFSPKGRFYSTNEKEKSIVHGQATFINTSKFHVKAIKSFEIRKQTVCSTLEIPRDLYDHDETALLVIVSPIENVSINIAILNLHLYWDHRSDGVKISQLNIALETSLRIASEYSNISDTIITGDFNSPIGSPVLNSIPNKFVNVYQTMNSEPSFTRYSSGTFSTIDHIYSSTNFLNPQAVLSVPDQDTIRKQYISFPARFFPSDHIPISAVFKYC